MRVGLAQGGVKGAASSNGDPGCAVELATTTTDTAWSQRVLTAPRIGAASARAIVLAWHGYDLRRGKRRLGVASSLKSAWTTSSWIPTSLSVERISGEKVLQISKSCGRGVPGFASRQVTE